VTSIPVLYVTDGSGLPEDTRFRGSRKPGSTCRDEGPIQAVARPGR